MQHCRESPPAQVLNVAASASQEEIKKAYRRSCLLLHPDKNPGDQVTTGSCHFGQLAAG